jgi:hypothetical protein
MGQQPEVHLEEVHLEPDVIKWLEACGYPRELIERYHPQTRLVQDIGIVGPALEEQLQVLQDVFHVDFSEASVGRYFPSPLGIDALVISILPRSNWAKKVLERYPPITLGMIGEAIENKKWTFG